MAIPVGNTNQTQTIVRPSQPPAPAPRPPSSSSGGSIGGIPVYGSGGGPSGGPGGGSGLSTVQVAALAYAAGFRGQALVIAVAIARGESGYQTGVLGDTTITNSVWGPSVGLWQVRSLNAERGTGGTRDATRLTDPMFNARSAFTISGGGANFKPWTVFTKGIYKQYMNDAAAAVQQLAATGYDTGPILATVSSAPGGPGAPPAPLSPEEIAAKAKSLYGYLGWFLDHPEIGPLLKRAAQEGWDLNRLMGELSKTNWWKTTSETARKWDALLASDPAEAQRLLGQKQTEISLQAQQFGVNMSADRLKAIATDSLKFGWNPAEIQLAIAAEMAYNPNAPVGGAAGALVAQIKELADDYFIPITDKQAFDWAKRIVSGASTIEAVKAQFITLSASRFPQLSDDIKEGLIPKDYFMPYQTLIAQTLEMNTEDVDFMDDPKWMNILSYNDNGKIRPMTMTEAAQFARQQEGWKKTRNAAEAGANLGEFILKTFGAVA